MQSAGAYPASRRRCHPALLFLFLSSSILVGAQGQCPDECTGCVANVGCITCKDFGKHYLAGGFGNQYCSPRLSAGERCTKSSCTDGGPSSYDPTWSMCLSDAHDLNDNHCCKSSEHAENCFSCDGAGGICTNCKSTQQIPTTLLLGKCQTPPTTTTPCTTDFYEKHCCKLTENADECQSCDGAGKRLLLYTHN